MPMKYPGKEMADASSRVHVLRHIETGEFVCLSQGGREYLAAFTDGDSALRLRAELGMVEFVDVAILALRDAPFSHFWLDGQLIGRGVLQSSRSRAKNG
jgi:hypothetical protein